jgi:asparagine synthase (glutamine-hydrolysing)
MCGFFGYIGNNKNDFNEDEVSTSLLHRGPDDKGEIKRNNFYMGFRRLSILDLSFNGHQPMSRFNAHHLCFNGEIYNYKEIKSYLKHSGKTFTGNSDTEVLLQLLIEKKEACLDLLNGMFCFAYIDEKSEEFIIARDRLGVKPLYYSIQDNVIFFASELPTLLKFGLKKEIDLVALNRYIHFGHITPPLTIYKNIFKLEPGHFIKGNLSNPSGFTMRKWWDLPYKLDSGKTEATWLKNIDDLLSDAVRIRLEADVPTGLFLSGGIDSSLVAYYSANQSAHEKPKAFSVIFDENDYSEFETAKTVADNIGLQLLTIKINTLKIKNPNIADSNIGEPYSDSSIINQYYLSKEARKHATVFLTGDGGDEAFAGYNEYITIYNQKQKLIPVGFSMKFLGKFINLFINEDKIFAQRLSKLSMGYPDMAKAVRNNYNDPILKNIINKKYKLEESEISAQVTSFWEKSAHLDIVKRMQCLDYKNYLEPDVLVKVDRATMLNSIEARSPFLDYRVVELGLQIPNNFNIDFNKGKLLLRKLAEKHLPPSVTQAKKKGFGLPVREWINESIIDYVRDLHKKNSHDFFDETALNKYVFQKSHPRDLSTLFWKIWMFEEWFKTNIREVN